MEEIEEITDCVGLFFSLLLRENVKQVDPIVFWLLVIKLRLLVIALKYFSLPVDKWFV